MGWPPHSTSKRFLPGGTPTTGVPDVSAPSSSFGDNRVHPSGRFTIKLVLEPPCWPDPHDTKNPPTDIAADRSRDITIFLLIAPYHLDSTMRPSMSDTSHVKGLVLAVAWFVSMAAAAGVAPQSVTVPSDEIERCSLVLEMCFPPEKGWTPDFGTPIVSRTSDIIPILLDVASHG